VASRQSVAVAVAAGALAVVSALGVGRWRRSAALPSHDEALLERPFAMCIARREPGAVARDSPWSEPMLAASVRALSVHDREALEQALYASVSGWESRVNPLLEDVEGRDPDAALDRWLEHAPAAVTTARSASHREACATDGLCAHVVRRRDPCPPEWERPATDAQRDRARFLLWSYGHALAFVAPDAVEASRAASAVRAGLASSRHLGLVLSADDLRATELAPLAELRRLWGRRAVLKRLAHESVAEPKPKPSDSLLALDEREVMVLPRLEALGHETELIAEIRALAPTLVR